MQFDFPTILFLAALVTGLIWLLDVAVWRRRRGERAGEEHAGKEPVLVEYSRSFFPIIVIVLILRSFLMEPFRIPSGSMMPTLVDGDFILVNKFAYGIRLPVINKKIVDLGSPQRGDVMVFRYPRDPSIDYIKRVVGLPGDRITYRDKRVYVNGAPFEYDNTGVYVSEHGALGAHVLTERIDGIEHRILVDKRSFTPPYDCMVGGSVTVPEGEYFVMGDNRDHSNDSRFWCGVPDENLVGKAFFIWMNWGDWGRIGMTIQ